MKILAIICLLLGLSALGAALYCHMQVIPDMEGIDRMTRGMDLDDPRYAPARALWFQRESLKTTLDVITLIGSGLGLIGGIFAGVKKAKLGWIAAVISVIALVVGLLQSTHMFS
ncbi:hypothetical protein NT6N_21640 [Oceaniferula spumae]|uniref:DUF4064 domain-containing protein n=1 Tax=Oceaniferula spumae TaxID=2979115 RepID=A0AAT9FMD6_9BACT